MKNARAISGSSTILKPTDRIPNSIRKTIKQISI